MLFHERHHSFFVVCTNLESSKSQSEPIIQSHVHIDYFIFDKSQK